MGALGPFIPKLIYESSGFKTVEVKFVMYNIQVFFTIMESICSKSKKDEGQNLNPADANPGHEKHLSVIL